MEIGIYKIIDTLVPEGLLNSMKMFLIIDWYSH